MASDNINKLVEDLEQNEYFQDLQINKYNLEHESENQPQILFRWATRAQRARAERREAEVIFEGVKADFEKELEEAKFKLEVERASLFKRIKTDPSSFGLPNSPPTDKTTEACILSSDSYQNAYKAVIEAKAYKSSEEYKSAYRYLNAVKKNTYILEKAESAMEHRRSSIRVLVDLYVNEYWSTDLQKPNASVQEGMSEKSVVDQMDKSGVRSRLKGGRNA